MMRVRAVVFPPPCAALVRSLTTCTERRSRFSSAASWLVCSALLLGCKSEPNPSPLADTVASTVTNSVSREVNAPQPAIAPNASAAAPARSNVTASAATASGSAVAASPATGSGSTAPTAATAIALKVDTKGTATPRVEVPAPRPAAALVSSDVVTGEGYRTYMQMQSPLTAGSEATVTVHLEPQAPFKSNDKYPYRFNVGSATGGSAPSTPVTGASVSPTRTTLRFPITARGVGRGLVSGTFSFSVCTEEKCLVERAPLILNFEVVPNAVSAPPHP